MIEPFTVTHRGKEYTVDPARFPDTYVWLPLDDTWTVCNAHRHRVFNTRAATSFTQTPLGLVSESCGCVDCYLEINRNPKQTEIGLEEMPSWWTGSRWCGGPALFCEDHHIYFGLDECCRKCVDRDEEGED